MLYLGIDQHKRQLTVNLRSEDGSVILKRQVSTHWDKVRAFFADLAEKAGAAGGFLAILEVCGMKAKAVARGGLAVGQPVGMASRRRAAQGSAERLASAPSAELDRASEPAASERGNPARANIDRPKPALRERTLAGSAGQAVGPDAHVAKRGPSAKCEQATTEKLAANLFRFLLQQVPFMFKTYAKLAHYALAIAVLGCAKPTETASPHEALQRNHVGTAPLHRLSEADAIRTAEGTI
jgi:hypothetical protein